jgi:hypothetical protein
VRVSSSYWGLSEKVKQHDGDRSPSLSAGDSEGLELCLSENTKAYCGWAAVPAMLEVKARTAKLFRPVACALYSHFEDQRTDRTRCQKHRGNSGMMECTGLNYSIQWQMLGIYVLSGEALVFMKEGSLLKMKSFGRKVMSCHWMSGSHHSLGITILMSGSAHPAVQHHMPEDSCIFSNITVRVSNLTTNLVSTWQMWSAQERPSTMC